jgi:hypothetical protein
MVALAFAFTYGVRLLSPRADTFLFYHMNRFRLERAVEEILRLPAGTKGAANTLEELQTVSKGGRIVLRGQLEGVCTFDAGRGGVSMAVVIRDWGHAGFRVIGYCEGRPPNFDSLVGGSDWGPPWNISGPWWGIQRSD